MLLSPRRRLRVIFLPPRLKSIVEEEEEERREDEAMEREIMRIDTALRVVVETGLEMRLDAFGWLLAGPTDGANNKNPVGVRAIGMNGRSSILGLYSCMPR